MKKIGIVTPYKGYNFGTSLQAYAVKKFVEDLGYEPYVIEKTSSFSKGRDITLRKCFTIFRRGLIRPNVLKKSLISYEKNFSSTLSEESKKKFIEFNKNLSVHKHSYTELKKIANKEEFAFFICGSDQIWNATNLYLDPLYYLRFVPAAKRVAFAPSFGKEEIPKYNQKEISKRISTFRRLSCREEKGIDLINEMTHRKATLLLDPTLLVNEQVWKDFISDKKKSDYILLYFLDKPNPIAEKLIRKLELEGHRFKVLNYTYTNFPKLNTKLMKAGPKEFLEEIAKCRFVLTDSFHGTVFSILFQKDFYVFNRMYGVAANQSTRVENVLSKFQLNGRLVTSDINELVSIEENTFVQSKKILQYERQKAKKYLLSVEKKDE